MRFSVGLRGLQVAAQFLSAVALVKFWHIFVSLSLTVLHRQILVKVIA